MLSPFFNFFGAQISHISYKSVNAFDGLHINSFVNQIKCGNKETAYTGSIT